MPGVETMAPAALFFFKSRGRGRWRPRGSILFCALACQLVWGAIDGGWGSVMALHCNYEVRAQSVSQVKTR